MSGPASGARDVEPGVLVDKKMAGGMNKYAAEFFVTFWLVRGGCDSASGDQA